MAPRWFLVRDVHASNQVTLLKPRWALSYLRGPMAQSELRRALGKSVAAVPVAARVPASVAVTDRSSGMGRHCWVPMTS